MRTYLHLYAESLAKLKEASRKGLSDKEFEKAFNRTQRLSVKAAQEDEGYVLTPDAAWLLQQQRKATAS